ncbi:Ubiquitin carboxyl-terminal hydrolase 32 [Chelonia mydas]|uniref:ubiquitinyl hydrolase 1 n=1 Tax=Chelonia mydas TaxID=8469 RepID=M7BPS8_CHEMY|nr:Ubiquitin carboxyl-terminal hydrolase 32 [Chelonia mydas]
MSLIAFLSTIINEILKSRGWLERESRYGLQPGHNWFLIAMQWWQQWKEYVKYDANPVVIEPSSVLSGGKNSLVAAAIHTSEQREDKTGGLNYFSVTEEKFSDNISTASEASETTTSSFLYSSTPAADMCFARQHNTSDNNNQCLLGSSGNILLQLNPQRPGAIDNQPLVTQEPVKAASLTLEGGRLKRSPHLVEGRDYKMVPEPVWRALYHWYGANLALPRPVIKNSKTGVAELELFPRYLLFLRQQPATRTQQSNIWVNMGNVPSPSAPLKRVLAYTGCFSRMQTIKEIHEYLSQRLRIKEEDMRLWLYNSENYLTLLDDEDHMLEYLKIQDEQHLVIEVRNKDMSWPEEMSFIANSSKIDRHKVPTEKGATGLSNLGNTCFMNSSIQCVSNTQPLTRYFISGKHLYELNRTNPIGMKGHMAKCYGDLVQELWSGTQKNIAPLKLRWTIAKYAPRFNGFQQQDSQELLAFLLDGLHEDLNRVHDKPYVELKDSDGRPDWEVAAENFPQDNQKVRLSVSGFLCAFEIPVPGSPTSASSPVQTDFSTGPSANGMLNIMMNGDFPRPTLIPNGMPNTVVPCGTENNLANGMMNGHVSLLSDSPFIGYIIAVHRKMESKLLDNSSVTIEAKGFFSFRFCRGCKIECAEDRACIGNAYIAVDWDPTALHLRYQTSQERIIHLKRFQFVNGRWIKSQKIVKFPRENFDPSAFLVQRDPSHCQRKQRTPQVDDLSEPRILQGEPRKTDLQNTYTSGEGDVLNRSPSSFNTSSILNNIKASPSPGRKSGTSCPSSKNSSPNNSPRTLGRGKGRLRLPQIGKNKLSNSKENLDASKENGTDQEQKFTSDQGDAISKGHVLGGSQSELFIFQDEMTLANGYVCEQNAYSNGSINGVIDNHSEEDMTDDQREVCFNPIYNLYAISCHSGIMGGGHYVTYAKNPNNKWYCYNDSSCKELHPDEIDTDSAYILFYEQQGVDYAQFLPKIDGKKMADTSSMDEDFESDYKKYCVLQ